MRLKALRAHKGAWALAGACAIACIFTACGLAGVKHAKGGQGESISKGVFELVVNAGPGADEQKIISRAEGHLTQRCMRAAGFRFFPGTPVGRMPIEDAIDLYSWSGKPPSMRLELNARRRWGYGLYERHTAAGIRADAGGINAARDHRIFEALGPQEKRRYEQTINECHRNAVAAVYGSESESVAIFAEGIKAFGRLVAMVNANKIVTRSIGTWSRCVFAASGLHFATPNAIVDWLERLYARQGPSQAVRQTEVRLSVTDGRCQFATGMAQDYAATVRKMFGTLPKHAIAVLGRSYEDLVAAVARAEGIVEREEGETAKVRGTLIPGS